MGIRPLQFIVLNPKRLFRPFLSPLSSLSSSLSPPSPSPSQTNFPRLLASEAPLSLAQPPQKQNQQPPPPHRLRQPLSLSETLAQKIGKSVRRAGAPSKSRVYADVNVIRPKEYWDYETLTVQWG